ncbi:pgk-1 [Symbiodinium sp. CCMP2592]|nr:pgk-1 [Symbiodinium sp. CCMP2592]
MAQPVTTMSSSAAAQPITTYASAQATPITTMPAATTYIMQADGSLLPQAQSMVVSSPYSFPSPALDHSQGKWFAPGEPLPAGFVPVAHPEGHLEPKAHHAMTEAVKSMTGVASAPAPVAKGKADKKKSKKKKSSACC